MYEVSDHHNTFQKIADDLKKEAEDGSLEGILVIKVFKNNDIEVASEFGRRTSYEWVGLIDFASDVVKGRLGIWQKV